MEDRERVIVFGPCGEIQAGAFFPLGAIEYRKEGVGAGIGADFGVVDVIREWQRLGEYLCATDDKEFGLTGILGEFDAGFQRGNDFDVRRQEACGTREHDQFATGHLPLRTFVGFAAHEDMMAYGEAAEMLEVIGEVPGETVVAADAAFLVDGGDDGDQHAGSLFVTLRRLKDKRGSTSSNLRKVYTATRALMWG